MKAKLFTIGHSTHPIEKFFELLSQYSITAIADVRSHPYSRYNPQFNRETLKESLKQPRIEYVFLGDQLGVRSKYPEHYIDSKVQYSAVAASRQFAEGRERLVKGMEKFRIALMCAEKDPISCHRSILVTRYLRTKDLDIIHIREDGSIETNEELEERLLRLFELPDHDLFTSHQEMIEHAYELQSDRIAYTAAQDGTEGSTAKLA